MTLAHVYHIVRLLRLENERLMKRGHPHMNVDEMRFVISGVLGPKGRELFEDEVRRIENGNLEQARENDQVRVTP